METDRIIYIAVVLDLYLERFGWRVSCDQSGSRLIMHMPVNAGFQDKQDLRLFLYSLFKKLGIRVSGKTQFRFYRKLKQVNSLTYSAGNPLNYYMN